MKKYLSFISLIFLVLLGVALILYASGMGEKTPTNPTEPVQPDMSNVEDYPVSDMATGDDWDYDEYLSQSAETSEGYVSSGELNISFIDVGQGDCILIQDNGSNMLIDAGTIFSINEVEAYLNDNGVDSIDAMVLTHPDADHIGGAADIVAYYGVSSIYMPDCDNDTKTYGYLATAIMTMEVEVYHPQAGDLIPFGTATYEVVGPVVDQQGVYDNTNSYSLILRVQNGNDSFLLTGDATGEETDDILDAGIDVHADVLKASHHGSANDGCNDERFWNAVSPDTVVISCGYGNDYGHPHKETMDAAQGRGCKLYRTDLQGTISCRSTGNGIIWNIEPCENYLNGNSLR